MLVDVELGRSVRGPLPRRIVSGDRAAYDLTAGRDSDPLACDAGARARGVRDHHATLAHAHFHLVGVRSHLVLRADVAHGAGVRADRQFLRIVSLRIDVHRAGRQHELVGSSDLDDRAAIQAQRQGVTELQRGARAIIRLDRFARGYLLRDCELTRGLRFRPHQQVAVDARDLRDLQRLRREVASAEHGKPDGEHCAGCNSQREYAAPRTTFLQHALPFGMYCGLHLAHHVSGRLVACAHLAQQLLDA